MLQLVSFGAKLTKLLPPKGCRFGGLTMPHPMDSTGQPATGQRLQRVFVPFPEWDNKVCEFGL